MKSAAWLLALVLLTTLGLVGGAYPAAAAQPERSESVLQGSQVLAHCTGFDVIDQYNVTVVTTRFVDRSGVVVEIHMSLQGTDGVLVEGDPDVTAAGWWQDAFLYARAYTIAGGANELLKTVVAERALGLPRDPS